MADLNLPILDLSHLDAGPEAAAAFRDRLSAATHDVGFFYLTGTGVTPELEARLHRTAREFFELPEAGKLARLPVKRYKILAFILCSVLASIAGILDFSFIQTSQPDIGLSQTFPVFAAVIIGGASLAGGKGTIIGTLGGALLLAELQIGLALLSPGPHVQQIFLGAVTIGAVALDLFLTKLRKSRTA